jgi:putative membrane protein
MAEDAGLMPLLSGLFGVSVLLPSITAGASLPEQDLDDEPLEARETLKPICVGTAAGAITGVIPSMGPSQGTVLAQAAIGSRGSEEFLTAVSSTNTSKALFSFVALYAIGRARSGAAVAVQQVMDVGATELVFLIGVALLAGGISTVLGLKLGKFAAKHMERVPYRTLCIAVLGLIVTMTFFYSGVAGLLVLVTATAVGFLPAAVGVKRTHAMGVIMLPYILFFAGAKSGALKILGL